MGAGANRATIGAIRATTPKEESEIKNERPVTVPGAQHSAHTQPRGALSPPPAAARRTPVNASTVAPRATGWRSGPGTRLYPKERGDNGLSAAPPREGGFGTARHERHPPSARAHAVAAGASFSATGTGQRAEWLEWRAALRGFAAEGLRGACVASSVCAEATHETPQCAPPSSWRCRSPRSCSRPHPS